MTNEFRYSVITCLPLPPTHCKRCTRTKTRCYTSYVRCRNPSVFFLGIFFKDIIIAQHINTITVDKICLSFLKGLKNNVII